MGPDDDEEKIKKEKEAKRKEEEKKKKRQLLRWPSKDELLHGKISCKSRVASHVAF